MLVRTRRKPDCAASMNRSGHPDSIDASATDVIPLESARNCPASIPPMSVRMWVWASTKPGLTVRPSSWMTNVSGPPWRAMSDADPTATIVSPSMAIASTVPMSGSIVTMGPPTRIRSAGESGESFVVVVDSTTVVDVTTLWLVVVRPSTVVVAAPPPSQATRARPKRTASTDR